MKSVHTKKVVKQAGKCCFLSSDIPKDSAVKEINSESVTSRPVVKNELCFLNFGSLDTRSSRSDFMKITPRSEQLKSASQTVLQGSKEKNELRLFLEDVLNLNIEEEQWNALKNDLGDFKDKNRAVGMTQFCLQTHWTEFNILNQSEWKLISDWPNCNCFVEVERL